MRIIYQSTVLADGGKGSPVGFAVAGSKQIASTPYLRASHGRVFDRGNKSITLSWQQTRQFATAADAQQFAAMHSDDLPTGEAALYLTLSGDTELVLTDAVLDVAQLADYGGVKTVHSYSATGRTVTGGSLPSWASGGAGIVFDSALLSGGGTNGFATFGVGGSKSIDLQAYLRSGTARPVDQRNQVNSISWEQHRQFATADEAEQFLLLHAQAIPDGIHSLTITLDNGTIVTLADAVMQLPRGRRIAATRTVHSYQATGRAITADAPIPGWIDPNTGEVIDPNAVTHDGITVTHNGEIVTHTP
ncbi:hypothetical protein ACWPKS_15970 [Coraliomargarita sp. W4R72]